MKLLKKDYKKFVLVHTVGYGFVLIVILLEYLFDFPTTLSIGMIFTLLGLVQFYLRDKIWFIPPWKFHYVKPVYSVVLGIILILVGMLMVFAGLA